jgi:hypothetical protein
MKANAKAAAEDAARLSMFLQEFQEPRRGLDWSMAADVVALLDCAAKMQTEHVDSCNYGDTPRRSRANARQMIRARDIAAKYGMLTYVQSDPRGWPLYIIPKSAENPEANYQRDGFGLSGRYGNRY